MKNKAAQTLGRLGGLKTALKGSAYYKAIRKKRKIYKKNHAKSR